MGGGHNNHLIWVSELGLQQHNIKIQSRGIQIEELEPAYQSNQGIGPHGINQIKELAPQGINPNQGIGPFESIQITELVHGH